MTFRLGRGVLFVSASLLTLTAFCIVAAETGTLLAYAASLAVHEAAHAIAAKNAGYRIERIAVYPFGAVMQLCGGPIGRDAEWTVAAAGPLCSLAVSGVLGLVSAQFGRSETVGLLLRINLAIAAVNMLPAYPLDGGRILSAVLRKTMRERAARTVSLILTALFALGASAGAILLSIRGKPLYGWIPIAVFVTVASVREWKLPEAGAVAHVMERREAVRSGAAQRARIVVVTDSITVGEALALLSARHYTILRVRGSRTAVDLDEADLLDAAARFGGQEPLKNAICN